MRLTVLGSGGFRVVPRPGCRCRVCVEAREKGFRRLGPSMFVHDENILFDTPENIIVELEKAGIDRVGHIFYTHWHPDHTFGARIVEQMNTDWSDDLSWRQVPKSKTTIHMPGPVYDEIMERLGPFFKFWEHVGIVDVKMTEEPVPVGSLTIEPVIMKSLHRTLTHTAIYVVSSGTEKVLYAPCDITPFPDDDRFYDCDLMILQTGWWGEEMAERAGKGPHYEISMDEIIGVIEKYEPGRVVLTHIGDELGMTLADLDEQKRKQADFRLKFAYDGMKIEI
jgi:phosphoribosyl 1,2-cyclic phosphate phosphodiesterase